MLRTKNSARRPIAGVIALASLSLTQCDLTSVYQPVHPDKAHLRAFHLGTYSTKLEEGKEIEGTIFQTTISYDFEKQGVGWHLHRKLDTMVAKGYHKFSMPNELEKKINLDIQLDSGFIPTRIDGYDSLKTVLGRIQQKEEFRKQLLLSSDSAHYRAELRDWWRMNDFLPRGQKLEPKQKLSVDELNKKLETLKADSAHFDGPRPRLKKSCLDYTINYHRTDSLPLLVEQFFFSALPNRKYRRGTWKPGVVLGTLQYSVDRKTGLPCFQSKSEVADMTMLMKEDKEKPEVPFHLYRYEEDIYE